MGILPDECRADTSGSCCGAIIAGVDDYAPKPRKRLNWAAFCRPFGEAFDRLTKNLA